jgi:hypothetical protein
VMAGKSIYLEETSDKRQMSKDTFNQMIRLTRSIRARATANGDSETSTDVDQLSAMLYNFVTELEIDGLIPGKS